MSTILDALTEEPSPTIERAGERAALGFCLTTHPCAMASVEIEAAGGDYLAAARRGACVVAATCTRVLERRTKAGDWMAILWLEDERTRQEAVCFPRAWLEIADVVESAARAGRILLLDVKPSDGEDKIVISGARPLVPDPPADDSGEELGDFVVLDVETCVAPEDSRGPRCVECGHFAGDHRVGARVGRRAAPRSCEGGCSCRKFSAPTLLVGGAPPERVRVVEIGAALFRRAGAGHALAAMRSSLCDPGCPIDEDSRRIHGISDEDVRCQPTFADRAARLAEILNSRALVTYNGLSFDLPVLAAEFTRAGVAVPAQVARPSESVDVYRFVRARYPRYRERPASKRLQDQAAFFRLRLARAHRATDDAVASGQLLLALRAAGLAPRSLRLLRAS